MRPSILRARRLRSTTRQAGEPGGGLVALDLEGAGPSFECRNKNGSTKLRATSAALTNLVVKTSYGSMEIRLPAGLKPAVPAHTTYGTLKSDFPLLPKTQTSFADVPAGTPRLTLENQNGNIRIVRE